MTVAEIAEAFPGRLTADEIRDMLTAAKAPAPAKWALPRACATCAQFFSYLAAELDYIRKHDGQLVPRAVLPEHPIMFKRAQGAVNLLRRELPKIIDWHSAAAVDDGLPGPFTGFTERLKKERTTTVTNLRRLQAALIDVEPPRSGPKLCAPPQGQWEKRAIMALTFYEDITGRKPGLTRNGPAIRLPRRCFDGSGTESTTAVPSKWP